MANYTKQLNELVTEALRPLDDEDARWKPVGRTRTPAELTWTELDYNRRESRRLFLCNEYAIGGTQCRVNYIVGQGFKYEFVAKNPGVPVKPETLAELNQWLADLDEVNDLASLEAEAMLRLDRDGEVFFRLFSGDVPTIRFVEPERVKSPAESDNTSAPALGIIHDPEDINTVTGYWIEPAIGADPEEVNANEIVHIKANTDSSCLRGSPTYAPVFENLRRCEDLLASMSSMAKARAKIALVMSIENFNKKKEEDVVSKLTQSTQENADGTRTQVTIEKLPIGSILRVPDTTQVSFPNSAVGAADYIEVLQADLRAIAQPLNMPEWMFTGLADQKYSNAFVVEAPTLRAFSRIQKTLTTAFGTGREGRRASLVWRAVNVAVEAGRFDGGTLDLVKLNCTAPALEVRDKAAEASVNVQYITAGVKSVVGVQRELGLDPEQVAKENAEAKAAQTPAPATP